MPRRPAKTAAFAGIHPTLDAWFASRFPAPTPAQAGTLPHILAGRSVLLSSPTGTGKTLAAFLGVFDHLQRLHEADALPARGIVAVYVSPLRALAYDLQKNLHAPLAELGWSHLHVAARTGDTSAKDRAAQKKKPPHILVTTPESLTLLLSQPAWAPALASVRFLLVDELHALAENKRGSLLALAAERLEAVTSAKSPLTRIGLSATVSPLPELARFLAGPNRPCEIVEILPTADRPAQLAVFSPLARNPYPAAGTPPRACSASLPANCSTTAPRWSSATPAPAPSPSACGSNNSCPSSPPRSKCTTPRSTAPCASRSRTA